MTIGIDGNEANVKRRVGISEWAYWLLYYFAKLRAAGMTEHNFVIYLKDKPVASLPPSGSGWEYKVFGPQKMWTQFALPARLLLGKKPDVFFTPSHYAPRFSVVPTVTSVMDLSYFRFSELFNKHDLYQLVNWTKYSVKQAKKVITISESSKNDIIKAYDIPAKKIAVVYPGIKQPMTLEEPHIYGIKQLQAKHGISDKYILFVGTLQPRKNIVRLIEAFAQLKAKTPSDLQLVIIGKKGWQYEEILEAPEKFGVKDQVTFLQNIGDDELPLFYKNAVCYALPSLYEGFGLPVVEAMQYGCPVITSNISSLPEAGGAAALYVDPTNVDDIAEKIEKLVTHEDLRKKLIAKGHEQAKKFSWEKTAKETLAVLEDVAKK